MEIIIEIIKNGAGTKPSPGARKERGDYSSAIIVSAKILKSLNSHNIPD